MSGSVSKLLVRIILGIFSERKLISIPIPQTVIRNVDT